MACCWYMILYFAYHSVHVVTDMYWLIINVCFVHTENNWDTVPLTWLCRIVMNGIIHAVCGESYCLELAPQLQWDSYWFNHISPQILSISHIVISTFIFMSRSLARFMPLLMKWFSYWHFKRSLTTNNTPLTFIDEIVFTGEISFPLANMGCLL
jgi:hypothetical protein